MGCVLESMCDDSRPDADAVARSKAIVGRFCPACNDSTSVIDYMEFLDPHDNIRLDPTLFECQPKIHTFVLTKSGDLRLLAEHGQRCKDRRNYSVSELTAATVS